MRVVVKTGALLSRALAFRIKPSARRMVGILATGASILAGPSVILPSIGILSGCTGESERIAGEINKNISILEKEKDILTRMGAVEELGGILLRKDVPKEPRQKALEVLSKAVLGDKHSLVRELAAVSLTYVGKSVGLDNLEESDKIARILLSAYEKEEEKHVRSIIAHNLDRYGRGDEDGIANINMETRQKINTALLEFRLKRHQSEPARR